MIDYTGGRNIVMPMYNLLEYSEKIQNIQKICYRDKINGVGDSDSQGKSFKYKAHTKAKTPQCLAKPSQPSLDPDGSQPPEPPQPLLPTLQKMSLFHLNILAILKIS